MSARRVDVGPVHRRPGAAVACLLTGLLTMGVAAHAEVDTAAAAATGLTITPTEITGVVHRAQPVGPFSLTNNTKMPFAVRVLPVLLGQRLNGTVVLRDDPASRRTAQRMLEVTVGRFVLAPGARRTVGAVVAGTTPRKGIYAGVAFGAIPTRPPRHSEITTQLRLNGSVLLAPRDRRLRVGLAPPRGEQAGARAVRLVVDMSNRGNTLARMRGRVRVVDARGKTAARIPLHTAGVLPGFTVETSGMLTKPLPRGTYGLDATMRAGDGRALRARGTLVLVGANQVRTENARLASVAAPDPEQGDPVRIHATFLNTGNVPYRPNAVLVVRRVDGKGQAGPVVRTQKLQDSSVAPGAHGTISGGTRLNAPVGARLDLTVALSAGRRPLDRQSTRVQVRAAPSVVDQVTDYLREHAVFIIGVLIALVGAGGVLTVRYIRRLKRLARDNQART
jgi:hypothetical protein